MKSILVPVDGSEHADRAVELAADLANKYKAKLILMHVYLKGHVPEKVRKLSDKPGKEEPPMAVGAGYIEAQLPHEVLDDIADKLLGQARKTAEEHGAEDVETAKDSGNTADCILARAKSSGVDTIIMGSRGLSDIKGMLVGSVSHKISHVFEGNVITVK